MIDFFRLQPVFKVAKPEYVPSVITDWGGPNWPEFCLVVVYECD